MAKATTTFLLADDDEDFRFLLEQLFRNDRINRRLYSVGNGIAAKDYLEGKGQYADRDKYPLPDFFLIDLKLEGCSGFELLEWLNSHGSQDLRTIRRIVLTGSIDPAHQDRAYKAGAHVYLIKSGSWEQFQKQIVALADQ